MKILFAASECVPFVKTGGLADVVGALSPVLKQHGADVRVILPLYQQIPQQWKDQMKDEVSFTVHLCWREQYCGIKSLEYQGVTFYFVENEYYFGRSYIYGLGGDEYERYGFFSRAVIDSIKQLDFKPDVIHCHDWQASLVPLYKRTKFWDTPVGRAKTVLTIHNLRFQGICSIQHLKYWSGLRDDLFDYPVLKRNEDEANMFKGGLAFADRITTVSETYAQEIQTPAFGEGLDSHLRYHSPRLSGIVNGIDVEQWDPSADGLLAAQYDSKNAVERKKINKDTLQKKLGLDQDGRKMVIGLISRLTDQKGLDLVDAIFPQLIDGNTQVVILGTGDPRYENAFRYFEGQYKGSVCSYISYNETLAHLIYAGADAFLVPSLFEPCGLTQLIAMHYGTVPVVRETGGLKDTVQPFCREKNEGNGFTFDRYDAGLLLDAVNRAKTVYFTERDAWDAIVKRNMEKDVSWAGSAKKYLDLYDEVVK